jgi:hypothetical protein
MLTGWALAAAVVVSSCETSRPAVPPCKADWNSARLLLDCFDVEEFSLAPVLGPDGEAVSPATFTWQAPDHVDLVVCAVFTEPPTFVDREIVDFDQTARYYMVRQFSIEAARTGTFELASAIPQDVPCLVSGAGCWAYSVTSVVGATALWGVDLSRAPTSCGQAICPVVAQRRLGTEVAGTCTPFCGAGLDTGCVCADGGCTPAGGP